MRKAREMGGRGREEKREERKREKTRKEKLKGTRERTEWNGKRQRMGKRTVDRRANSPLFRDGRVNHGKSIRESLANTLLCRLDGKKVKRGRREKRSHGVLVVDRW